MKPILFPALLLSLACNKSSAPDAVTPVEDVHVVANDTTLTVGAGAQTVRIAVAAPPPATTVATKTVAPAARAQGDCAQLAATCARCPAGVIKSACETALTAGSIDPVACRDGLRDRDIQARCN